MNNKLIIGGIAVLLVIGFLAWLFIESSKPLPGEKIADLGRGHVPIGEKVDYNSNPPTSGKHYQDWIRSGIYTEPKDDRYLVHSLEHGYIIISYNCDKKVQSFKFKVKSVYAHGVEEATPSASSAASEDCHKLVDQLISVYEKKGKRKLIIILRPNLDSKIALTAWNYIDKFNDFDISRIEKFIDTHRDMGPEKTME